MSQSHMGGTYNSLSDFRAATLNKLGTMMDSSTPIKIVPHNIIGGGDEEWAALEMVYEGKAKNGDGYRQTYAWATRWTPVSEGAKIVQVRAYLDSALLDKTIESNS